MLVAIWLKLTHQVHYLTTLLCSYAYVTIQVKTTSLYLKFASLVSVELILN